MGQAWVFDDTIEHEAWNDADQMRVILIFDVWNQFLTEAEKALITAMLNAQRDYLAAGCGLKLAACFGSWRITRSWRSHR